MRIIELKAYEQNILEANLFCSLYTHSIMNEEKENDI